jgi:hypothetical protein
MNNKHDTIINKAIELYKSGKPLSQIARTTGLKTWAVRYYCVPGEKAKRMAIAKRWRVANFDRVAKYMHKYQQDNAAHIHETYLKWKKGLKAAAAR